MDFIVLPRQHSTPPTCHNTVFLRIDHWNDYSFVTMFYMSFFDSKGESHDIGNIKIGFKGQTTDTSTHSTLEKSFTSLDEKYFSIGEDETFYKNISKIQKETREEILISLNDIVHKPTILNNIENEEVLNISLFRSIALADVKGRFIRVLNGLPPLTNYKFSFVRNNKKDRCDLELPFEIYKDSTPSTNIHALIGRNGCGKTTIINEMIEAISNPESETEYFKSLERNPFSFETSPNERIPKGYFRSLISVSFSAFDPFTPPKDQTDPAKGTQYYYIGLKDVEEDNEKKEYKLQSLEKLRMEFVSSLIGCLRSKTKKELWFDSISNLSSDKNFDDMGLTILNAKYIELKEKHKNTQVDEDNFKNFFYENIESYLKRMSSGHAIVLFTITRLVDTVDEKSLVLLDEPEVHLHPPLLSAFLRTLSNLLLARNGVAIVATHSPVVLQEIPKSCVWKIIRSRTEIAVHRPSIETFGENQGVLTREAFALEVASSGYHSLLKKSVESQKSYNEILEDYNNQIGSEGRTVLKAMILNRDNGGKFEKS